MGKNLKFHLMLSLILVAASFGNVVAYWNFEDGTADQPFTPAGEANGSGYTTDVVNGYQMHGWNDQYGPSYSSTTADGSRLSMRSNGQDGYVYDVAMVGWSPTSWTIETAINLDNASGWQTIIGRDGSSQGESEADFYLQNNGLDDRFRLNFDTVGGQRWVLDSDIVAASATWYAVAVMSDGVTLSMYIDEGNGYQLSNSLDISAQSVADNALQPGYTWTFGRGWFDGNQADKIYGYMDNVRFSDTTLATDQLVALVPEPATMALLGLGGFLIRKRKA
ncbi:MAG: LamG-like jellyroll fold domain-containing protein [Phycisphaerae bacterium]